MLNLNLNTLLTRLRDLPPEKASIDYEYVTRTFVSSGFLEPEAFATMSIEANPYQPFTLFITGSDESGNVTSGSLIGAPVIVAISGSGIWPETGSVQSQIFITNNFGFNKTVEQTLSEAEDNLYLSGSIISASFAPADQRPFIIFGTLTHTKGNIFNPIVNCLVRNISPVSDTLPVNGYTASATFVKDVDVPLFDVAEVTSSFTSSFEYLYNLGVTASLEAGVNNVTGSTTMSFQSVEQEINDVFTFFNPETETAFAMVAFLAANDLPLDFTASVEFNKGNLFNNNLNWLAFQSSTTEDLEGDGTNLNGVSSSFKLDKDIANIFDIRELTGSITDTYTNEFSFNQTASLTQNVGNVTGSVTMSIELPELGISVVEEYFNPTTSVAVTTASFESISTEDYNITASVINNKGNESNADINYLISASNASSTSINLTQATSSYEMKKDIAVIDSGSVLGDIIDETYKNDYSFNQTASIVSSYTKFVSFDSASIISGVAQLRIPELGVDLYSYDTASILTASFEAEVGDLDYNVTASFEMISDATIEYVIAGGGGNGGPNISNGGAGGGGAGSVITGSIKIRRGRGYQVNIGSPQTDSTFIGPLVALEEIDLYPSASDATFLIAKGGGVGGGPDGTAAGPGLDGGSGGGGAGTGENAISCEGLSLGAGGNPISASVLSTTSYDLIELTPTLTGKSGAPGTCRSQPFGLSGRFAGHGGAGGGVVSTAGGINGGQGINISWVNINNGSIGGGGAAGYNTQQWVGQFPSASHGGGTHIQGGSINAIQSTGAGGAGDGGLGASGSMSIRYPGLPQATGGTVIYNEEGFTVHTFTENGEFVFNNTAEFIPTTASFDVEFAVVGGGGAGGISAGGGGGGAGEFLSGSFVVDLSTDDDIYTFNVGDGGLTPIPRISNENISGGNGKPTFILKGSDILLFADGGGGGAGNVLSSSINSIGGSGGGAAAALTASFGSGSTNGGLGVFLSNTFSAAQGDLFGGGGGGGHLQSGSDGRTEFIDSSQFGDRFRVFAGAGGDGIQLSIIQSQPFVAGGGGGGVSAEFNNQSSFGAPGGSGVGGTGAFMVEGSFVPSTQFADGTSGIKNTGSGGGGSNLKSVFGVGLTAGNGGSGVVYIKFPNTINLPFFSGQPPVIIEEGDFYILKFIEGETFIKFI